MRFPKSRIVLGVALFLALPSTDASAHWCDDLWTSAYDIVVRADSDTSPKELYVENRLGYQLINFQLTATSSSGGAITLTAPTTLKVKDTLLPGEKGTWKISGGNPSKIEDLTFAVKFGNTSGSLSKQYACYPVEGASPVMVMKKDGSLFPNAIVGLPTGPNDLPKPNTANGCTYGDVSLGRNLQEQTIADWEDLDVGLDNLLTLYCSGRGSWGNNDRTIKPNSYCKDTSSTSCPSNKPTASPGSRSDYMRLWGAGALAIRKGSLGSRLSVFRERLKCGANDGDTGIAGYTLFVLGYLGDDAGAKSFLQTQAGGSGDLSTIAKAALYLSGDTTQKSAVQDGVKSSSVWVKVACAGALGIVDKDDSSVNSAIIPEVKWIEPDNMGGDTDNGKGMYSAHILELVAMDRRGWTYRGNGEGAVTFYGETGSAAGKGGASGTAGGSGTGTPGAGGKSSGGAGTATTGNRGGANSQPGAGGTGNPAEGSGGSSNTTGPTEAAGSTDTGGVGGATGTEGPTSGSSAGAKGNGAGSNGTSTNGAGSNGTGSNGTSANGAGSNGTGTNAAGNSPGSGASVPTGQSSGCHCRIGERGEGAPGFVFPALAGLMLLLSRSRSRRRNG